MHRPAPAFGAGHLRNLQRGAWTRRGCAIMFLLPWATARLRRKLVAPRSVTYMKLQLVRVVTLPSEASHAVRVVQLSVGSGGARAQARWACMQGTQS